MLATRTYIPDVQGQWIDRIQLVNRINKGLENNSRLTLVSAPAGAGKSTLLIEWARQTDARIAWVSLDEDDNDPQMFWMYCLSALASLFPVELQPLQDAFKSPQPLVVNTFLNRLTNILASLNVRRIVLVLDDYHLIHVQAVHDGLAGLLEHMPANLHLILATRSDPPFALHRLRANSQLTEVRFDDLRFSMDEITEFLNNRMNLRLDRQAVETLEQRTEGWAVGLHLAALLMQKRPDPAEFIARFSSNNQYILEYLTNEVLASLSEEDQDFLLKISLVPQFNPELCDAMLARCDCRQFIERFWKANLFLIPLDDENYWFRFHHLFADLLVHRLRARGESHLQPIYQRAADWYAANHLIDEAIRFSLMAGNPPMAARLVLENRRQAMNEGDFRRFTGWMEKIPANVIEADARLCFAYAAMLSNTGQAARAEHYLKSARHNLDELVAHGTLPNSPDYAMLPGQIAAFEAMSALRQTDFEGAVRIAENALAVSQADDHHTRGMAGMALGLAQAELGRMDDAIFTLRKAAETSNLAGNRIASAVCLQQTASLLVVQGELADAGDLLDNGLRTLARNHMEGSPAAGVLLTGLAEVDYRHNRLEDASENLKRALELVRPGGFIEILKTGAILKSKIQAAVGDITGALDALAELLAYLDETDNRMTREDIHAAAALLHTRANHIYEARAWAENQDAGFEGNPGLVRGEVLFTLARVLTYLDRVDEARTLLVKLEMEAGRTGSRGRQVEACLFLSMLELKAGNRVKGYGYLSAALTISAVTGDLRIFLDEGPALLEILEDYAKSERMEKPVSEFIHTLVAAGGNSGNATSQAGLVEKLSERELQVLTLMSEGLTNPEIAGRLFLSLATVKTHLNNIYGKLDARNRADAVMRAKELRLL